MRGGRNFPARNSNYQRSARGGFRGNADSNYRGNGSSSRYEGNSNGRSSYGGGTGSGHYNSSSSSGGRSRFPSGSSRNSENRRSSYGSTYRDRGESPERKRFRHEGGGSRRDFSSSSDHGRFDSHNSGSSYRQKKRSPPPAPRSPFREGRNSNSQRSRDNMGPPTRFPPRKVGNTYRGRPAPARGVRRARVAPARGARSTVVRRRITREQDTARRAKIARLRSSIKKHSVSDKTSRAEGDDEGNSKKINSVENDEKSGDETEGQGKKATTTKKIKKTASENGDDDNEALEEEEEELDESVDAVDNEEPEGDDIEAATDEKKQDAADGKKKERSSKKDGTEKESVSRKNYIALKCVHCRKTYTTFHEYNSHLHFRGHKNALRRVALEQKAKILKMRYVQRQAQREVDGDTKNSSGETTFCMLCRLNYKSPKAEHQASQEHREMKKFLMPFCKACRIGFKSPMDYEVHRCTLDHVKREGRRGKKEDEGEAELQVDLDEFTLVDSVGDIDENENEDSDEKGEDTINPDINVGAEHVKRVEAFYCDLCHYYLPMNKDPEEALKKHCNIRSHLKNYLRHQEDQSLRLCAEKIHRRHQGEKGDDTTVDKVWEDVDKDLGELLEQTDNAIAVKDEDEDEDSTTTTERYDRFKNSEKTSNSDDENTKIEDIDGKIEVNEDNKE